MPHGEITCSIDSRFDDVWLVGTAVRAIAAALCLDDETATGVELCVVEAMNNAIEHAYRAVPGHRVEVVVAASPEALRVAISDRGAPMAWPDILKRARAAAADAYAEGGRGLLIMQSLADQLDYVSRDGVNTLTLVKRLDAGGRAAAAPRRASGA